MIRLQCRTVLQASLNWFLKEDFLVSEIKMPKKQTQHQQQQQQLQLECEKRLRRLLYPIEHSVELGIKRLIYGRFAKGNVPGVELFESYETALLSQDRENYNRLDYMILRKFFTNCGLCRTINYPKTDKMREVEEILLKIFDQLPEVTQRTIDVIKKKVSTYIITFCMYLCILIKCFFKKYSSKNSSAGKN